MKRDEKNYFSVFGKNFFSKDLKSFRSLTNIAVRSQATNIEETGVTILQ